ncbi:MAG: preprotein translocase subunit YajC [Proteobacteria bacterium]|nr:preprotein translocase subunit YajC [Candidatus Enterousia scatequi]
MDQVTQVVDTVTQSAPNAAAPQGSMLGLVVYCILIFAVIYLFMVRPNKKRMAEYQKMLDGLKVGNRILAAGIYGTIKKINDKSVDMEVAKGVVIEVSKGAIASVEQ